MERICNKSPKLKREYLMANNLNKIINCLYPLMKFLIIVIKIIIMKNMKLQSKI